MDMKIIKRYELPQSDVIEVKFEKEFSNTKVKNPKEGERTL